jgi:hypothetical protein
MNDQSKIEIMSESSFRNCSGIIDESGFNQLIGEIGTWFCSKSVLFPLPHWSFLTSTYCYWILSAWTWGLELVSTTWLLSDSEGLQSTSDEFSAWVLILGEFQICTRVISQLTKNVFWEISSDTWLILNEFFFNLKLRS